MGCLLQVPLAISLMNTPKQQSGMRLNATVLVGAMIEGGDTGPDDFFAENGNFYSDNASDSSKTRLLQLILVVFRLTLVQRLLMCSGITIRVLRNHDDNEAGHFSSQSNRSPNSILIKLLFLTPCTSLPL